MKSIKFFGLMAITAVVSTFTSCKTDDATTKEYTDIYFMDTYNEDIETLPIDGGTPSVLAEGIYGVGIAYDKENEKIYYSDFANDSTPDGKIWKADLDGGNAVVIASGIQDPYGIAIDSKNNKIYWGDDNGNVSRCDLDGSDKEDIVSIDGGGIRAVAIDETNSKLYFYDVQNNSLYKANLDGSNKSVIIEGYYGYAIAVDEKNSKIYFDAQTDDESISALYYANLDGTSPTLVDDTQSRIYGIAIDTDNSKVYWSGRDSYEIYQANLNGTGKVVLASDLGSPRGIFLKY
jgi:DNA-binding beta-propeller fold protein YncE